jgi:hypothetical protein
LNLHYQLWLLAPISLYLALVWTWIALNFASSALQHIKFGPMYVIIIVISLPLLIKQIDNFLGTTIHLRTRPDGPESLRNETNETNERWIAPRGAGSLPRYPVLSSLPFSLISPFPILNL